MDTVRGAELDEVRFRSTGDPAVVPRWRGWIHLWSFVVAVAAGVPLIVLAGVTVSGAAAAAVAVYTATLLGLFGTSALYHRRVWRTKRSRTLMDRLDHSMIFVFIAGTYTPITVLALAPPTDTVLLVVTWAGAVGGIVLTVAWPVAPRWVGCRCIWRWAGSRYSCCPTCWPGAGSRCWY